MRIRPYKQSYGGAGVGCISLLFIFICFYLPYLLIGLAVIAIATIAVLVGICYGYVSLVEWIQNSLNRGKQIKPVQKRAEQMTDQELIDLMCKELRNAQRQ